MYNNNNKFNNNLNRVLILKNFEISFKIFKGNTMLSDFSL